MAVVVTAVVSVHYLQQAMQHFGNNQVVPVYYATFTLACVIGAAVVYKELDGSPPDKLVGFFIGILVAFGGVFAIGMRRKPKNAARDSVDRDNANLLSDQDLPADSVSVEMEMEAKGREDGVSALPGRRLQNSDSWAQRPRRLSLSVSGMGLDHPEVRHNMSFVWGGGVSRLTRVAQPAPSVRREDAADATAGIKLPSKRRPSVDALFESFTAAAVENADS